MRCTKRRAGFTLVEMLVVIGIIVILAAILVPVYSYGRRKARAAKCAAHLTQIAAAIKLYEDDHHFPPGGDLRAELVDYVDSRELFVCPEDPGGTDSYSGLYVSRPKATGDQYVVGCAFHGGGDRTIMTMGKANASSGRDVTIVCGDQQLDSGDTVVGGVVAFSDGSRVTVQEGMTVGIVAAAANAHRAYNIVYVPSWTRGTLTCETAEGSAFEVVTPAAIAGVREASRFALQVGVYQGRGRGHAWGTRRRSAVTCEAGSVLVEDRFRNRERRLDPGETCYMSIEEGRTPKDPNWPPGKGRGKGGGNGEAGK